MKLWALLTVVLYIICLSIVIIPMFLFVYPDYYPELLGSYYLFFVPVFVLVQAVLLFVPVAVVRERPIKRRRIVASAVLGSIPIGIMALAFVGSIILIIWGEEGSFEFLYKWPVLIIPAIFWLVWGIIFFRSFSSDDPMSFTSTIVRWLLGGSVLELLVAIPSHIISRHREECCAPPLTFLGIVTGLSIALMSFGPGVFFLFAKKIKYKRGNTTAT